MEIKLAFIPKYTKARCGYSMVPRYITVHNTANTKASATAKAHAEYMNSAGKDKEVSYHYVVDDGEIYQLIPDGEVAWHAGDGGSGTGNRQSLAIEICENQGGDLLAATDLAAELTGYLMDRYNIPLSNVVQHNYWSGKNCPNRIRKGQPYGWSEFLDRAKAKTADADAGTEQLIKENERLKAVLLEIENLVEGVNV